MGKSNSKRIAYSFELATQVCAMLTERDGQGNLQTLRQICAKDGMPRESTVYQWLGIHEEFAEMYARAREELTNIVADDIMYISDTEEDSNRARVRIDARKWWLSKVNSKKYGDRSTVDLNVGKKAADLTDDELKSIAARGLVRAAGAREGQAKPE